MIICIKKPSSVAFLLAFAVLGNHSFHADAARADRELQDVPPASGMTKAESGLSEEAWTKHITIADEIGCQIEDWCNQCKGWCISDDDCYGILECFTREGSLMEVPGCILPEGGFNGNKCYLPPGNGEYYPQYLLPKPLTTIWGDDACTVAAPCPQCKGLCDIGQDDECQGDLRCSSFINNKWPTGDKNCNQNGYSGDALAKGYCMPAEDYVDPNLVGGPSADYDASVPDRGKLVLYPEGQCPPDGCPVCSGPSNGEGCTSADVCAEGLECYAYHDPEVDKGYEQVAGCSGQKNRYSGYCYTKDKSYKPAPIPYLTEAPSNDDYVHTNVVGLPEECAIYAVDQGKTVDVPFSGSSQLTTNYALFRQVTYIYVVDSSRSTIDYMHDVQCGDGNSDLYVKTPIDCEIFAIEKVNEAANLGGNVDLVGLISFNNTAKVVQPLIEPWARLSDDRRDPTVIDLARTLVPEEATNYEAGVELACEMARDPINDNLLTVVIFLSDGAPNLGNSVENTIKSNCNNAIFQTFAVTEKADCDKVDTAGLRPGIDDPNTLREISNFSGGVCAKVPDVSKLPGLLVKLEKTTWDGVTVKVNGVAVDSPIINYSSDDTPPLAAPGTYNYTGSVPLGPGQHQVCFVTSSSTSGIEEINEKCKTVVVNSVGVEATLQEVDLGSEAELNITFVGVKPGCDAFSDKTLTVESCDGNKTVTTVKTGTEGNVKALVAAIDESTSGESCYKVCYEAPDGSKSCAQTIVEFTTATPSLIPSASLSTAPITPIPTTSVPSGSPSSPPVAPEPTTPWPSTSSSASISRTLQESAPVTPEPTTPWPSTSSSPSVSPTVQKSAPVTPEPTTPWPSTSSSPSVSPTVQKSAPVTPEPTTPWPSTSSSPSVSPTVQKSAPVTPEPTTPWPSTSSSPSVSPTVQKSAPVTPEPTTPWPSTSSSPSVSPTVQKSAPVTPEPTTPWPSTSSSPSVSPTVQKSAPVTPEPTTPWPSTSSSPSVSPTVQKSAPVTPEPTTPWPSTSSSPSVSPTVQKSAPVTPEPTTPWPSTSSSPSVSPTVQKSAPVTPEPTTPWPSTSSSPSVSPTVQKSAPVTPEPTTPWPSTSSSPSVSPTVQKSDSPNDVPVTPAPTVDAPITAVDTPATNVSSSATTVSSSPPASPYCNDIDETNASCKLCEPFRSPDYCDPSEAFASLVQARTSKLRNDPLVVSNDGYWFHALEDKIAAYLLTVDQDIPAPEIYCCVTKVEELAECLETKGFKDVNGEFTINGSGGKGIVVKATNFHSNQGIFILVNETTYGPGITYDLIQKSSFTFSDVSTALNQMQASKVIVEEFIGTSLPIEYKLHVINGKVQAIDVIQNRGEDCACFAVVDTEFNRLDYHGCFEPGGTEYKDPANPECTSIDFDTGAIKAGPVKKDMYLCEEVVKPDPCVVRDMINIAEKLGRRIGVAMRVDMFVEDQRVYVQEYSPNPMNGLRHCTAKVDENGCVDSCFLGREWKAAGGGAEYGGPTTAVPDKLKDYLTVSDEARCDLISGVVPVAQFSLSACASR